MFRQAELDQDLPTSLPTFKIRREKIKNFGHFTNHMAWTLKKSMTEKNENGDCSRLEPHPLTDARYLQQKSYRGPFKEN